MGGRGDSGSGRHAVRGEEPELAAVIAEERMRLADQAARFHPAGPPNLRDKQVLLVDDGLATGATTEVAVRSVRKQGAAQVLVAAPVASDSAVQRLAKVANQVVVLVADPKFMAVGHYYRAFQQTTDEEVVSLLRLRPLKPPPSGPAANPANPR